MKVEDAKQKFQEMEEWLRQRKQGEENKAQNKTLEEKVWLGLYDMKESYFRKRMRGKYGRRADEERFEDVFLEMVESVIRNYDTKQDNTLESYVNSTWASRSYDVFNDKYYRRHYKKGDIIITVDSSSRLIGEDEERSLEDTFVDEKAYSDDNPETKQMADYFLLEIMQNIIEMDSHRDKRKNNPVRIMYYKLFYTEKVTLVVKEISLCDEDVKHSKQIAASCEDTFLDYYMKKTCRNLSEINNSPLKKGWEVGDMKINQEELPLPLSNTVYRGYLKKQKNKEPSDSVLSQNRKSFKEFLELVRK